MLPRPAADMAKAVVPGDRDDNTDEQKAEESSSASNQDHSVIDDFGIYQMILFISKQATLSNYFLVTQVGYLPVAGGMLATTFMEPSKEFCTNFPNITLVSSIEFHSLLIDWSEHCRHSSTVIVTSTIVMLGAVVGAFWSGFLADRFGRKPIVVGTMLVLFLGHGALVFYAAHSKIYAIALFFIIGCSSGGYIVVNLVLMIESLEKSRSRLLVVSLNGWPLGMSFAALVGYLTLSWRSYHMVMSITAAVLLLILQLFSLESVRWLINHDRLHKADKVQVKINNRNKLSPFGSSAYITVQTTDLKEAPPPRNILTAEKAQDTPMNNINPTSPLTQADAPKISYSYFDLFRYTSVLFPVLALFYSFTASSIISFGFYFTIEILPGNRYINLASMGALKLALGFLPFLFSMWFGRRPIFLVSIGVACASSAILLACHGFFTSHWMITVLSLLITASMDPAWKINHLHSAELFPTVVRNMCRAVCNVGARFGSLVAPGIIYLRHEWELLPYVIFVALLTGQLLVGYIWLPETKDRPLIDSLSDESNNKSVEEQENELQSIV